MHYQGTEPNTKPSSYRCEVKWNRIQWRHNIRNKKEKPPKRNVACRKTFPKNSLPRSFEAKCENCVHAAFHLSNFVFFSVSTTVFRPLTYKLLIHSLFLSRTILYIHKNVSSLRRNGCRKPWNENENSTNRNMVRFCIRIIMEVFERWWWRLVIGLTDFYFKYITTQWLWSSTHKVWMWMFVCVLSIYATFASNGSLPF